MGSKEATALQQIRDKAKAAGLARKLFTQGAEALSPLQITQELKIIFRAIGVDLPPGAIIPLDAAQFILAGGVVANGISQGMTIAELTNPGLIAVQALSSLLSDLGVIDKFGSDLIGLGVSGAIAISNCGLNILADLAFIASLITVIGDVIGGALSGNQEKAEADARKNLRSFVTGYVQGQYDYAASQIAAFNQGSVNYFDAIANIARNSPYTFKGFFPDLGVYFPDETITLSARGQDSGWFGDKTASAYFQLKQALISREQLQAALVNRFITTPMREYFQDFTNVRSISVRACATLSMIQSFGAKGPQSIPAGADLFSTMVYLGVTPSMLGDNWFFLGQGKGEEAYKPGFQFPYPIDGMDTPVQPTLGAMVVNGRPYQTAAEKKRSDYYDWMLASQMRLSQMDQAGDIAGIAADPLGNYLMRKYARIYYGARDPAGNMVPHNIDLTNYWKCAGLISYMKKSDLFGGSGHYEDRLSYERTLIKLPFVRDPQPIGPFQSVTRKVWVPAQPVSPEIRALLDGNDAEDIQARVRRSLPQVLVKNLTRLAENNIAEYIGVKPEKLTSRATAQGYKVYTGKAG